MKPSACALGFLACAPLTLAAAERITVIGDSLTKEYQITFVGLPGVIDGLDSTQPFARNWSEILHERRNAHFDLGQFKNTPFFNQWSDLRLLGHEYNWAVPGATARALRDMVTGQDLGEITGDPDFSAFIGFAPDWAQTSARMTTQAKSTSAAAVIWCGGNDLRFGNTDPTTQVGGTPITYQSIYDGNGTGLGNPQPLMASLKASIQALAQHLRTASPTLPIAVCAVPHIGATPVVRAGAPTDAVRTGRLTTALRTLNAELQAWTEGTLGGAWVDTYSLTEQLTNSSTLNFGGVTFQNASDTRTAADPPSAHHRYLFSHDGFHPGTTLHAIVAQRVQAALKAKTPAVFGASPDLTHREIITTILGLPANTGFSEFMAASGAPAGQRGPEDNPDGDPLNNLAEFFLAENAPFPGGPVHQPTAAYDPATASATLTWTPRFDVNIYASAICQSSTDFSQWTEVPAAQITENADGSRTASVAADGRPAVYLRLKISAAP